MSDFIDEYEYLDNDSGDDPIWDAINRAFSPSEAVAFRNYIVSVHGKPRQLDYFIYHRTGLLFVIKVFETEDDEFVDVSTRSLDFGESSVAVELSAEGEEEVSTFYPLETSQDALDILRTRLESSDIPVQKTLSLLYFPNQINREISGSTANILIGIGGDLTTEYLRGIVQVLDREVQSSAEILRRVEELLSQSITIRDIARSIGYEERFHQAQELSQKYKDDLKKDTLIFISYRRQDTGWAAGRIYGHLRNTFKGSIFFDYDSIPPGVDWEQTIEKALDDCVVMLVVIGPRWATIGKYGNKRLARLYRPNDWVRKEVRRGLAKGIPMIPIMIDKAQMPSASILPHGIKRLPRWQGIYLNLDNFFAKMDVLVDRIIELLKLSLGSTTP